MHVSLPDPVVGELFLSLVGRVCAMNLATHEQILGTRLETAEMCDARDLGMRVGPFTAMTEGRYGSVSEVIRDSTLGHYLWSGHRWKVEQLHAAAATGRPSRELAEQPLRAQPQVRYCRHCVSEAWSRFGAIPAYRVHQGPLTTMCSRHGTPLDWLDTPLASITDIGRMHPLRPSHPESAFALSVAESICIEDPMRAVQSLRDVMAGDEDPAHVMGEALDGARDVLAATECERMAAPIAEAVRSRSILPLVTRGLAGPLGAAVLATRILQPHREPS